MHGIKAATKQATRLAGAIALLAGVVVGLPPAASATTGPIWGKATLATLEDSAPASANLYARWDSVSCPTANNCVAVGTYLDTNYKYQAIAQAMTDGVWAKSEVIEFEDGVQQSPPDLYLISVSCTTVGNCTAAGQFKNINGRREAFTVTSTDGVWAKAVPVEFETGVANSSPAANANAVSCGSAGNCTAVGAFMDANGDFLAFSQTSTAGAWAKAVPADFEAGAVYAAEPEAVFEAVSCASAGNCTATGGFVDVNGYSLGFTQTMTSGVWAKAIPAEFETGVQNAVPQNRYGSVSCASAGNCTVLGSFKDVAGNQQAFTQTMTSGVWAKAIPAEFETGVQNAAPNASLSGVSCVSAGNCTAVGSFLDANGNRQAFTQTSTSGVWAKAVPVAFEAGVQNATPDDGLGTVSCASPGNCTAVGQFKDVNGGYQSFALTSTSGVWAKAVPTEFEIGVQNATPSASLLSISCPSTDSCVAGGMFTDVNGYSQAFTQTLSASDAPPSPPSVSSVSPSNVPLAGGTVLSISGTGFDTVGGATVSVGSSSCAVTSATETLITCRVPSSVSGGLRDVTVTNTGSTLSDTLANAVRYVDASGWIVAKFPPPSAAGTTLTKDLQKILDSRGNCNRDVDKFFRDLDKFVGQRLLTRSEANEAGAFFLGECTQQTNPTAPVAPIRGLGAPVGANPPSPTCSASVSNSSFTLNVVSPEDPITQFTYERLGFDSAGFWVRVDSGAWMPAVGLVPANGSGSAVDWSSEFVQSLIHFGGVETFTAAQSYLLEIAFGTAGTLDVYDADKVECQMSLSVFVETLPETGTNTALPVGIAIVMTMAGGALVLVGRRRLTA